MAETVRTLEIAELQAVLAEGQTLVVDVLPPEHYAARHIPGARNACVFEVTFLQQMRELGATPKTPVVLYGAGNGSLDCFTAAEKLLRSGHEDVTVFDAGLTGWRQAGLSLEGSAPQEVEPPHPVLELHKERFELLPAECSVFWTGRNNNGGHWGRLQASDGHLKKAGKGLLTGAVELDMRSIQNLDLEGDELQPVLEDHLRSDDFFFSALFPKAVYHIQELRLIADAPATSPNCSIRGELELRGMRRPLELQAHLRNIDEQRVALLAHFDLDRTKWGVVYGSARFFAHLSYHVVYDAISLDVRLVLG